MTNSIRAIVASGVLLIVAATSGPARTSARQDGGQAPRDRGQTATMLQDGTILLLGGERTPGVAAVYDPRTRTTRAIGRLLAPRAWHTATVLPDGTVLIVGGLDRAEAVVPSVERFDPASHAFTTVGGTSLTPRAHHTATLLTDGRILFAGGDVSGRPGGGIVGFGDATRSRHSPDHMSNGGTAKRVCCRTVACASAAAVSAAGNARRPRTVRSIDDRVRRRIGARNLGGRGSGRPGTVSPSGVVAVSPPDGATDVPTSARVAIRFSDPLVVPSLSAQFAAIVDGSELALGATFVQAEGGMLAFLTPASPLPPGVRFRVGCAVDAPPPGRASRRLRRSSRPRTNPIVQVSQRRETEVATTDRRRWARLALAKAPGAAGAQPA